MDLAVAAWGQMGETMIKKRYVESMRPDEFARLLHSHIDLPLQRLMTKAVALAPMFKKAQGPPK